MPESPADEVVSRSQRRREAQAVFDLARDLVKLPAGKLGSVPLPDEVRGALDKARRIKAHVARKRETQHVAKLMRELDCEPIQAALYDTATDQREEAARQHRCEDWRAALLDSSSDAITALCAARPGIDAGRLRQLVRTAVKEQKHNKAPTASRQLFRALREIDLQQHLPPLVPPLP